MQDPSDQRGLDPEPDILAELCQRLSQQLPQVPAEVITQTEARLRQEYGGLRTRIAKRKKHPTAEQRQAALQDGLSSSSAADIAADVAFRHKISRATLYRYMKRGL